MKTYINRDTLELLALIARGSPAGFIIMGNKSQHVILKALGLVTEIDRLGLTRTTELGEKVTQEFIEKLRSL